MIGMDNDFTRLFRRGIGRDGIVDVVRLAEGNLGIVAVDGTGRGENKPLDAMPAHGFQNPVRAGDVDVLIAERIGNARPHPGQGGKVDNRIDAPGKNLIEIGGVPDIAFKKSNIPPLPDARQIVHFIRTRIERIKVIESDNDIAVGKQSFTQMTSNESGGAGD